MGDVSKNARNKRRKRATHRDQWARVPRGTPLAFLVKSLVPAETPLLAMLRAQA